MTLDAVATRAGVSKGGLLYHFPNKEALLKAMVQRSVDQALAAGDGELSTSHVRALIERRLNAAQDVNRTAANGFIAAVAEHPSLFDPIRDLNKAIWRAIKVGNESPDHALLAWLAVEGLFYLELFNVSPLSKAERLCMRGAIQGAFASHPDAAKSDKLVTPAARDRSRRAR